MDEVVRRLERRIATGDLAAEEQLQRHYIRLGYIPSDDDLLLMRCGFAVGGQQAVLPVLGVWQNLLTMLLNGMAQELRAANAGLMYHSGWDDWLGTVRDITDAAQEGLATLPRLGNTLGYPEDLEDLYGAFRVALGDENIGLNFHLDHNRDLPPIYLHYNDITQSVRIAYLDPVDDTGSPRKLDTTFRKVGGSWQVELSWNVGNVFNYSYAEYQIPTTLEDMCFPFFSYLPCFLQQHPGVWQQWGWSKCNYQTRSFGNWDYDPIVSDLGSRHWLHG